MTTPLSYEQLNHAVEIIEDFMETEGLAFWITIIKGDEYKPVRWVSPDILRSLAIDEEVKCLTD